MVELEAKHLFEFFPFPLPPRKQEAPADTRMHLLAAIDVREGFLATGRDEVAQNHASQRKAAAAIARFRASRTRIATALFGFPIANCGGDGGLLRVGRLFKHVRRNEIAEL